ncbi:MAG: hypothetical protein WBN92_14595 [Terriglobia bacterium]
MKVKRGKAALVIMILVFAVCAACRHAKAPVITDSQLEGRASYRVLNEPETSPEAPDRSDESITAIYPFADNKTPEYPAAALKSRCKEGVVPVRIHVGTDGTVTGQEDIPGRPLPADACHRAFREAVRVVVNGWKFIPAFRVKPVAGGESKGEIRAGPVHYERTPLEADLDYEFLFQVVHGKGVVSNR